MAGASTDVETAHGFITIRALPSLKVGITAVQRHVIFAALHAASPDMSSEEVGRGLAATTRVYTSHTWAAFHAEWSAYRQIPPPYLSMPEPEASPHLIAGVLVSEDGFLANICNANKTELSKLFAVKYELLSETRWLQILRDLSNHAKAASADKRPERDRRRPTSYFCEIAPEDFVPLALRSHKALPLKTSPARCKSSATPLWSKPSPRKSKSFPVTPKSHKNKPATPSSCKASHLPHTPHSSSALSISTPPCQSKRERLVPVVDLTDLGSPKRRSARTSTFSSSPKAKSTRRAEILRRAHAKHIVGGGMTQDRLARTLSREFGESEAFWNSEYDLWISGQGPYGFLRKHLRPIRRGQVLVGTGSSVEDAVDLSMLDD